MSINGDEDDKLDEESSQNSVCKEFADELKKLKNQLEAVDHETNVEKLDQENQLEDEIKFDFDKIDTEFQQFTDETVDELQIYSDKVRDMCCVLVHIANPCDLGKPKMLESLTDTIFSAIEKLYLKVEDLKTLLELIQDRKAFPLESFREIKTGIKEDLWDIIEKDNILPFAKILFDKKPSELNKPYRNIGKGEFMFCMLHPGITKREKGDLTLIFEEEDQKLVEVKGEDGELKSEINKDAFIIEAKTIAEKYGFDKESKDFLDIDYINTQAQGKDVKIFITELLVKTGIQDPNDDDLKLILQDDKINKDNFNSFLKLGFFEFRRKEDKFDYLLMVSEDIIYLIEANVENFKALIADKIEAVIPNINRESYPLEVKLSFK